MRAAARSRTPRPPAFRPLKLFGRRADPATRWARITLAEKLQHELAFIEVTAGPPPDELLLFNPGLQLPMLLDRDVAVIDILIIVEYLNERFPHPPMMPTDPAGRARLRLMMRQAWAAQTALEEAGDRRPCRELLISLAPLIQPKGLSMGGNPNLGDSLMAAVLPHWLQVDLDLPAGVAARISDYQAVLAKRPAVHLSA